MIVW